jgi:predicted nucleic acid-binding protein
VNVIVDTSVWSLALRRRRPSYAPAALELAELVSEGRAVVMGPIRQEILSGVQEDQQFHTLREHLRAFPDVELGRADHEEAARYFNQCRGRGIQGSNTDFLICAVSVRRKLGILTTDTDFLHFAKVLPIHLHAPRSA